MEEKEDNIKLTHLSHGMGCGCKMRPQYLEKILADLPVSFDPNLLVGTSSNDDAAVYKLNDEQAIVQTLDFFTPIVDDPYSFGAIAAANSISDIYAMGAKPLFALNIVAFPAKTLPARILQEILRGASDKAKEAGISIVGGHSIDDPEPKFGMCVTGIVHPQKVLTNNHVLPGDALILTKPLGTGVISTAIRKGIASPQDIIEAVTWMTTLNKLAAEVIMDFAVSACTDVTGFGLMGHLSEMTKGSKVEAEIWFNEVPFMNNVRRYIIEGAVPGGTKGNHEYYSTWIDWDNGIDEAGRLMICDAQTSGGLLIAVPWNQAESMLRALRKRGVESSSMIGRITGEGFGKISVKLKQ